MITLGWHVSSVTLTSLVTINSESLSNVQSLAPLHAIHLWQLSNCQSSHIAISSSCPAAQASASEDIVTTQTEDVVAGPVHSLEYFCTLIHFNVYDTMQCWDKRIKAIKIGESIYSSFISICFISLHNLTIKPQIQVRGTGRVCSRCRCWCCYSGAPGMLTRTGPFRHKFKIVKKMACSIP